MLSIALADSLVTYHDALTHLTKLDHRKPKPCLRGLLITSLVSAWPSRKDNSNQTYNCLILGFKGGSIIGPFITP